MKLDRYPEQDADASWLADRDRALLLLDPRVGKTPVALVAAVRRGAQRVAVLTKAIAREHWRRHFAAWAPGVEVRVDSYDKVSRRTSPTAAQFTAFRPDVLILDEGQRCKTPGAARTRAVYGRYCDGTGIMGASGAVWVLSGTLAPNNLGETWTHLHAMGRTHLGYEEFIRRFCLCVDNHFGMKIVGVRSNRIPEYLALIQPITLRRRFVDVFPHLPRASWTSEPLDVPPATRAAMARLEQAGEVDRLRADLAGASSQAGREQVLAAASAPLATVRRGLALLKAPLVADAVDDLLEGGVPKVVVMGWHVAALERIAEKLAKYGARLLHGGVPERHRIEAMDIFQQDASACRVLVCQIAAAGEGVALHAARVLVFAEYSWSLGELLQAANRIVTAERTDRPEIISFLVPGTIDADVERAMRPKIATMATINSLS